MIKSTYLYILIVLGTLLTGCSKGRHDSTLEHIDRIANANPDSAKKLLDAINPKELNTHNRHYYDFLTVKVNDKNYMTHTSDSLILNFIDYAEFHESPAILDEAYYYAGRVYSDLNDYPDAVKYYHKALDNLPSDSLNSNLHCRILIQTGRLLVVMRLNREAIKYFREVNEIAAKRNDTIGLIHNLHSLRLAYLRVGSLDSARICASEALELSPDDNLHLKAKSKMLLAEVFYKMGRNDTALELVRHAPEQVKAISHNAALSIAANIYQASGITDTTWMYVKNLTESNEVLNKHNGYRLIFSTPLFHELPKDSLLSHLLKYHDILEEFYNRNNAEQAMLQHTVYNYTQHDRARAVAEGVSRDRMVWIAVLIAVSVILSLTSLIFYEKQKRRCLELEMAKVRVGQLEDALHPQENTGETRQDLIETLRQTYEDGLLLPLADSVRDSAEYKELKRRIDGNLLMTDGDNYWSDMETMMAAAYPKLKDTLGTLTEENLSTLEWHVALMVKCRISQSDMARLLGVSRSAITHRLAPLAKKVLGNDATSRMITGAILLIG